MREAVGLELCRILCYITPYIQDTVYQKHEKLDAMPSLKLVTDGGRLSWDHRRASRIRLDLGICYSMERKRQTVLYLSCTKRVNARGLLRFLTDIEAAVHLDWTSTSSPYWSSSEPYGYSKHWCEVVRAFLIIFHMSGRWTALWLPLHFENKAELLSMSANMRGRRLYSSRSKLSSRVKHTGR